MEGDLNAAGGGREGEGEVAVAPGALMWTPVVLHHERGGTFPGGLVKPQIAGPAPEVPIHSVRDGAQDCARSANSQVLPLIGKPHLELHGQGPRVHHGHQKPVSATAVSDAQNQIR